MATGKAAALPAQYAKFITALLGVAIAYLTAYGTTWDLQGFLVAAGAALAVFGVPNADKPEPVTGLIVPGQSGKAAMTGAVTVIPPSTGPLPDPPAPGGTA